MQRQWRDHLSSDDSVWRGLCEARLGMGGGSGGGPVAPDRSVLPTYRAAWLAFQAVLGRYGELGVRAYRAWRQVEDWLEEHMPEVAASLRWAAGGAPRQVAHRHFSVVCCGCRSPFCALCRCVSAVVCRWLRRTRQFLRAVLRGAARGAKKWRQKELQAAASHPRLPVCNLQAGRERGSTGTGGA